MPSELSKTISNQVKVLVRARPLQKNQDLSCVTTISPTEIGIGLDEKQTFSFDHIFSEQTPQDEVYNNAVEPIMQQFFSGYNGTVFCYGQTGSGKTFTMFGEKPNHIGIIPRVMGKIFDHITSNTNPSKTFTCSCSFLEIYNEQVRDLLAAPQPLGAKQPFGRQSSIFSNTNLPPTKNLSVREIGGKVFVDNLSKNRIMTEDEAMEMIYEGIKKRTTWKTQANEMSSRSHSIFTIYLQSNTKQTDQFDISFTKEAKLHLIDLAGSERQYMTKTEGDRLNEARSINKSLSNLGNVVSDLSKGRESFHYRNSKLTHILKDSLGGNSLTTMICCVSTYSGDMAQTLSTLEFARRAKRVKNNILTQMALSVSGDPKALAEEIIRLKRQLESKDTVSFEQFSTLVKEAIQEKEKWMQKFEHKNKDCESLEKIIHGKDQLLQAAKFLLKWKEQQLSKAENRSPSLVFDDLDDKVLTEEELQREKITIENIVRAVYSDSSHPTVIALTLQNLHLRENITHLDNFLKRSSQKNERQIFLDAERAIKIQELNIPYVLELEDQLKKEVNKFEEVTQTLKRENHELHEKVTELKEELNRMSYEKHKESENNENNDKISSSTRESTENLENLQKENVILREKLQILQDEFDDLVEEKTNLEKEDNVKKRKYSDFEEQQRNFENLSTNLEKNFEDQVVEMRKAVEIETEKFSEEKKKLEQELLQLKETLKHSEDSIKQKDEIITTQNDKIDWLIKDVSEKESRLSEITSHFNSYSMIFNEFHIDPEVKRRKIIDQAQNTENNENKVVVPSTPISKVSQTPKKTPGKFQLKSVTFENENNENEVATPSNSKQSFLESPNLQKKTPISKSAIKSQQAARTPLTPLDQNVLM